VTPEESELIAKWGAFRFDYACVPGRELWHPYMEFLGQHGDDLYDILAKALKEQHK
jgi:hypothetical protein